MSPKESICLVLTLILVGLSASNLTGHADAPEAVVLDSPQAAAPATLRQSRASQVVSVRFCPPVKGTANCFDCPREFELEPCVTSVSDLASFDCTVCYDSGSLELQDVRPTGLAQECALQWNDTQGCVTFSAQCLSAVSGLGPIAKLSMRRVGTGFPTSLTWQHAELRDSAGQTLATTTESGCVASACIEGDVWTSCDCKVDVADALWCVVDWLLPIGSVCPRCDIDVDGGVSYDDCWAITRRFFSRCPECSPAPTSQLPSAVHSARPGQVKETDATVVSIVPTGQSQAQGARFGVDVQVEHASVLFGFEVGLAFDPDVLQVEDIRLGTFVRGGFGHEPLPLGPQIDNQAGQVHFGGAGMQPVSGSGVLAQVVFRSIGQGTSALDLFEVKLCTADILHANIGCNEPDQLVQGQVLVRGSKVFMPALMRQPDLQ